jgi:hypothetical protein
MIQNDGVRDDGVDRVFRRPLGLTHPISDYLATSKLYLFAIDGEVFFDLDNQVGIGQPDPVPKGRTEHFCIRLSGDLHRKVVQEFKELQEFRRKHVARLEGGLQSLSTKEKS